MNKDLPSVCLHEPFIGRKGQFAIPIVGHNRPSVVFGDSLGFTLIELLVVLTVVAILAGVAVPSFRQFTESNRLVTAANDLVADLSLARSEAVKRQEGQVTVCVSSTGTACGGTSWTVGWMTYWDKNGNGSYASTDGDVILKTHGSLPPNITTTSNPAGVTAVTFNRLGVRQAGPNELKIENTKISRTQLLCFSNTGRVSSLNLAACPT